MVLLRFLVLGIAANSLWFLSCCSQLCLGEGSSSLSGLLKESVISSRSRSVSAQYRLSGVSSSHPVGCGLPGFISPFPPFKDDKSVFLIKLMFNRKNTSWAGGGNLPLLKKRRSSKRKLDLPSSRKILWGQWAAFFRVNHYGAQEELLTSTLCFRAMSVCPVSDVALDSGASRKNSVLELCARMRKFHG